MLNSTDREILIKSNQTVDLLAQNLKKLVNSKNPLLAEIALDMLNYAVEIEKKLNRLSVVTKS